jgi:hypothetical protein
MRLHSNVRFLALPTNTGQGWKLTQVANTLPYYNMSTIAVAHTPGCC